MPAPPLIAKNKVFFMIQVCNGVHLPPRKKNKHKKCVTIRFVVTGVIPSKKNQIVASLNWRSLMKAFVALTKSERRISLRAIVEVLKDNPPFIKQSEKYREWEVVTREDILQQAQAHFLSLQSKHNLIYPITKASVSVYHYWKDNYPRDSSNKIEGIFDILVKAGIIKDDKWQCLSPIKADANIYSGEILNHITVVDLTAYEW